MDIDEIRNSMQSAKDYAEEAIDNIDNLDIDKKGLDGYTNIEIFDEFVSRFKSILINN